MKYRVSLIDYTNASVDRMITIGKMIIHRDSCVGKAYEEDDELWGMRNGMVDGISDRLNEIQN